MNNQIKRNVLLNPGPATTTDSVKYAQVIPDICPREQEFGDLMKNISTELTKFVANENDYTTVLFGGSGTAAIESILCSVMDNKKILIINNGAYGKRMCQIAEIYGFDLIEFTSPHSEPVDLKRLKNKIDKYNDISHLVVVHNETTVGLLNDIESIGALCGEKNIEMIVDAMSSYAAIPIDMEKMNIHYLAASSNKNIQGMAGVSFVIANIDSLNSIKDIKKKNLYLNLYDQFDYFIKNNQSRFTPPVQTIYALKQAILETKKEGIENRYARYSKSWETLIEGMTKLGLKYIVPKECHSKIITAFIEPDNSKYDFNKMHDFLFERGFTIYPGKISKMNTFRISNIGEIDYNDIKNFLLEIENYFNQLQITT